jgi:hypothetical protein
MLFFEESQILLLASRGPGFNEERVWILKLD